MKSLLNIILFIPLFFLAIGCTSEQKNLPTDFDYGTIGDGTYSNKFFEFELTFNPHWFVQNKEQMNDLVERGSELTAGNDKFMKAAVKASQINTAYLFTIFKHEMGSAVTFNPSFMSIAENISKTPGIKSGKDYLFHVKNGLKQSQVDYNFEEEIYKSKILEKDFYVLESYMMVMGNTITQEYYSKVADGFCLSFIVTYSNEEEREELYEILESVNI
jgi:hypothetical protein